MTLAEATTALQILRPEHLQKIALRHAVNHWPIQRVLDEGPALMQDHSLGWILRGTLVENIIHCEECRPALNAARVPDQEIGVAVNISRLDLARQWYEPYEPDGLVVRGELGPEHEQHEQHEQQGE